jgi:hypothetical protein
MVLTEMRKQIQSSFLFFFLKKTSFFATQPYPCCISLSHVLIGCFYKKKILIKNILKIYFIFYINTIKL